MAPKAIDLILEDRDWANKKDCVPNALSSWVVPANKITAELVIVSFQSGLSYPNFSGFRQHMCNLDLGNFFNLETL